MFLFLNAVGENRLSIGLTGGYINTSANFSEGTGQKSTAFPGISAGITVQEMRTKYAAFQGSILFSEKAFGMNDSGSVYKRYINYIEMPLLTNFHISKRSVRVNICVGPQFGLAVKNFERVNNADTTFFTKSPLAMSINNTEKFQFGLTGGMGISYHTKNYIIQLEGRYYQGFSNVLAPRNFSYINQTTFGVFLSLFYTIPLKSETEKTDHEHSH